MIYFIRLKKSRKWYFIAVTSLSVSPRFQGQGVGTALLATMKDLAIAQKRMGISLT